MSDNKVMNKTELLKSRLEQLGKLLNYKNRTHCQKYLRKIVKEFFE